MKVTQYVDFHERFNVWVDDDGPPDDFKFWVMVWLIGISNNPTAHAHPAPEFGPQWWFAKIPNAEDADQGVVCLYSITDDEVRCSGFTTLNKPIA